MIWLRDVLIRWLFRKAAADAEAMTRGKTWFAGVGQMLTGAGIIAGALYAGRWHDMLGGWLLLLSGLTTLGVGHKIEKQTVAVTKLLTEILPDDATASAPGAAPVAVK
jgi:hypothetical protein